MPTNAQRSDILTNEVREAIASVTKALNNCDEGSTKDLLAHVHAELKQVWLVVKPMKPVMDVEKTAAKLKDALGSMGYHDESLEQCAYYVRDVLSREETTFRSEDYTNDKGGPAFGAKSFTIDLAKI